MSERRLRPPNAPRLKPQTDVPEPPATGANLTMSRDGGGDPQGHPSLTIPTDHAERLNWFRQLAHVVHLGRCTRFPFGDCTRHEDAEYFTPKDNDIASTVIRWLEYEAQA